MQAVAQPVAVVALDKRAETTYPIHELLAERWSPRTFAPRPLSGEALGSLLEAARWAPSSRNEQPWRFVIATQAQREDFDRIAATLSDSNRAWAGQASALMIGAVRKLWLHNDMPNSYAWYDLGQAVGHLSVQASALGLHLHQMGGFDKNKARALLNIPDDCEAVVAIAIGHLGDIASQPEETQKRELAPRSRRPLEETVFAGQWGRSAEALLG